MGNCNIYGKEIEDDDTSIVFVFNLDQSSNNFEFIELLG